VFHDEDVAGTMLKVAQLPVSPAVTVPFFLTPDQHRVVSDWATRQLSDVPCFLLPVGTVKSGKSTLLDRVLPGIAAAQFEAAGPGARRPVIMYMSLNVSSDATASYDMLVEVVHHACDAFGLPVTLPTKSSPWVGAPNFMAHVARQLYDANACLWLLIDEFQAPVLHSTSRDRQAFINSFKDVSRHEGDCVMLWLRCATTPLTRPRLRCARPADGCRVRPLRSNRCHRQQHGLHAARDRHGASE